ncbi:hypothetical protein [Peptacetobacter hiranonis]|uniref:Uncharacterized protein n=1 Tax=Peptacetobacter hiranonis (strain DSM 13275 / JCM 10541 / KCTC 15199 / TO-931) TaxID=500633 RepID=B6FZX7_PEPHT|nr:hypothetical protein [Peptacetobacter hiranonis]EEA84950.1 hypothetical protein CLOHIR_01431 [Peptacetobacter hiranonis DSM 13275]QEK20788.1 hypothetical protein KGNDJEFE_01275 [Peptacetobacter hiranonis]
MLGLKILFYAFILTVLIPLATFSVLVTVTLIRAGVEFIKEEFRKGE